MDYADLARRLADRVLAGGEGASLSSKRRRHSLAVSELAAELCARSGLDPERGRAGGLAHDMCKELPAAELLELAAAYPGAADSSLLGPKAAHGPAAAVLLSREYGVADRELLDAVAFHTLGRIGMGTLESILYCADKLEPGRERVDPSFRERCLGLPPERMIREVVERTLRWLESEGLPVALETLALRDHLSGRIPAS